MGNWLSGNAGNKEIKPSPNTYNLRNEVSLQVQSSQATNQLLGCKVENGKAVFATVTHSDNQSSDRHVNWKKADIDSGTKDKFSVICTTFNTSGYHWFHGDNGLLLAKNEEDFQKDERSWFVFVDQQWIKPRNSIYFVNFDYENEAISLTENESVSKFEFH